VDARGPQDHPDPITTHQLVLRAWEPDDAQVLTDCLKSNHAGIFERDGSLAGRRPERGRPQLALRRREPDL
jgi:hypothetical protein